MPLTNPIIEASFALIDQEIGIHNFSPAEYAIVRRVIHATADFDFADLIKFFDGNSAGVITRAIAYLQSQQPIITDVTMVKQGIHSMVAQTFANPILSAIEQVTEPLPGKTLTETGILKLYAEYPQALYVIGNAPTALLSLCQAVTNSSNNTQSPPLIIGVPVGFIAVLESKEALAKTNIPHIRTDGRKGGSPVASAIINALLLLAYSDQK
jgi:precorrin-8X/cobalt-precorrin-8 methylmutase